MKTFMKIVVMVAGVVYTFIGFHALWAGNYMKAAAYIAAALWADNMVREIDERWAKEAQ